MQAIFLPPQTDKVEGESGYAPLCRANLRTDLRRGRARRPAVTPNDASEVALVAARCGGAQDWGGPDGRPANQAEPIAGTSATRVVLRHTELPTCPEIGQIVHIGVEAVKA